MRKTTFLPLALILVSSGACSAAGPLTVKAVNKLPLARTSETIELSAKDLASVGEDLERLHVKDAAGKEVLCQAVDSDYDAYHKPDLLIFQADFAPGETKSFSVTLGSKHIYSKEQYKAFGRFVRERFDDFAWENDRIAHRTYGRALETWTTSRRPAARLISGRSARRSSSSPTGAHR
jgi:pectinesterase